MSNPTASCSESGGGISEDSPDVRRTTLFKPVPFDGIDKDENADILSHIAYVETFKRPSDLSKPSHKRYVEKIKLIGDNGEESIQTGRALQVASVGISHTTDPSLLDFEIYGQISITDNNKSYAIYQRESNDPEPLFPDHDELSLCPCPIAPLLKGKVEFNLTTKNGVHFAANKDVDWSFQDECEDEEELIVYFDNGYYANMIYTVIPCALIVKVGMTLFGPPNATKKTISVGGDITVSNISFLEKKEFVQIRSDEYISVYRVAKTRTAFAIPAYSWLTAKVSLESDGTDFASGGIMSSPAHPRTFVSSLDCKDEEYHFSMHVDWIFPDLFFGLLPQICPPVAATSSPDHYVEIFSVFVGCCDPTTPLALTGTIVVLDREKTVYIYSRNIIHSEKLSSKKTKFRAVSLAWPDDRWVLEEDFHMHLKLKDDEGNDVCRGSVRWFECKYLPRFDRRMCAAIPGEKDGTYFAAVHYSIFTNPLRAKVTVTVECKGFRCKYLDVCGSIYAEYSNHDYSCAYDKEFYRIIILDRPWDYRAKMRNENSKVRLSKCLVTAPQDCQELILWMDLTVCPFKQVGKEYYDRLDANGPLRFRASESCSTQVLQLPLGGGRRRPSHPGCVTVKVEWFGRGQFQPV